MNKPIAVLISDIHFNLNTLELASAALLKAQFKAAYLRVPLVIAGDMHDSKANMRAEVVNKLLQMFSVKDAPETIILVGNHDLCNEKGKPHALNFLKPYATIVETPQIGTLSGEKVAMIPYYSDAEALRALLKDEDFDVADCMCVIMHQGLIGSNMGEYIQDKSAINPEDVAHLRVISGHYHARDQIVTRTPVDFPDMTGLFDYIGNPYTLSFGEANDPEKGYQILHSDGNLEFVPTNLRKHVIIDTHVDDLVAIPYIHKKGDLLWFKCNGTREELRTVTKELIAANYGIEDSFKLDFIHVDLMSTSQPKTKVKGELLDSLIDSLSATSDARKARLKDKWRHLCV